MALDTNLHFMSSKYNYKSKNKKTTNSTDQSKIRQKTTVKKQGLNQLTPVKQI